MMSMFAKTSAKRAPSGTRLMEYTIIFGLAVLAVLLLIPIDALAQVCTDDSGFGPSAPAAGEGMVSMIICTIQEILFGSSSCGTVGSGGLFVNMYYRITTDATFLTVLGVVLTIYVIIYGIMFTVGMVDITAYDFVMRLAKMSLIVLFTAYPYSVIQFIVYVVTLVNGTTDDLIAVVMSASAGMPYVPGVTRPFTIMDQIVHIVFSQKMAVSLMAMFFTGPYGMMIGMIMVMGLIYFVRSLLMILWVYIMSLILRTLLFGIAPIFIVCALFKTTKHLFDGWLNQIINACVQPVLLFTFFAFFASLMTSTLSDITNVPVCWNKTPDNWSGTTFHTHWWRYKVNDAPYSGNFGFEGPKDPSIDNPDPLAPSPPIFPISIVDVLIFMILAELAMRFNTVVITIAKSLTDVSLDLAHMGGNLSELTSRFGGKGGGKGGGGGAAMGGRAGGARGGPGVARGGAADASEGPPARRGIRDIISDMITGR